MSSPKFRDMSAGSRTIVLIELVLFAGALLLTVYLNSVFQFINTAIPSTQILATYALVFALVVQLSSLALGLYDSKLRENFRGVARRLLVSVAIGFFIVALLNPFYGDNSLPIDILAFASFLSLVLGCLLSVIKRMRL